MLKVFQNSCRENNIICSVSVRNGEGVIRTVKNGPVFKRALNTSCPITAQAAPQPQAAGGECPMKAQNETTEKKQPPKEAKSSQRHGDLAEWASSKPFYDLPGPKPLPIIGNTWRFLPKIGEYHGSDVQNLFKSIHLKYGNIVKMEGILGQPTAVYLFNPDDVEKVYKLEGSIPERDILPSMTYFRKHMRQEVFKDARGLLTSQGDEWYQFRMKVNAIMMQPKMIKQYVKPVDKIARELVKKIKRMRTPENKLPMDIIHEINKWSLETIAALALDTRLGCLSDDLPPDSTPRKMVAIAEDIFTLGGKLDFEPSLWKYISTPTYRRTMEAYNNQLNMSQEYINQAIDRIRKEKEDGTSANREGEPSVLEKLLEIDTKVAVVMALDMLLAGVDTTSTALVNILYYLSTNHSKQEILRGEIISLLPQKTSKLTAEHLNSMPYLKAVMKEASRLYPVTPGTMRILTKDTVLSGYQIPKGTEVLFPHMYLSIRDDYYHRADEFLPERWLRENSSTEISYKKSHPFAHMHFGFGARSCIGRRFAELELEVAVVNFMRNFNISWEGPPPKRVTTSINYLKGPFPFTFKNNDILLHGDMACIKNETPDTSV